MDESAGNTRASRLHRLSRSLALLALGGAVVAGALAAIRIHRGPSAAEWAERPVAELEALAQLDPGNAGVHLGLGIQHARRGDLAQAVTALERSIKLAPHRMEAYAALGEIARRKGNHRRAAEMFAVAVRLAPQFDEGYLHAANAFTHMQNYRRARPFAMAYSQRQSSDWRGPFLLGMISSGEGKMAEALSHYAEAVRRAPGHGPAYLNAGATYLYGPASSERLAAAAGWFERGLAVAPRYPELYYYLGLARFRQRRWAEAHAALSEAVELKPSLTEAYYPLAQSLRKLGRETEARLCLDLYARQRAAEQRVQ